MMSAKKSLALIVCCLLSIVTVSITVLADEQPDFDLTAKSAILMEAQTGEILFKKNADEELPPASMTKIMTMLLVMEALEAERVNLQDKLVISERAASMGGSQVYLEPGEEMTLEDLMKAIAIASANDASVAVGEYIAGTEEEFVKMMNEKAAELGLKNTYFYNTNGLPPGDPQVQGNYTSAYDLAVMSRELLKYPRVLEWTSTWIDYLRGGEFILNNTNKLVRHYLGADGIKTGYTSEAGFCVTSTAEREGMRFISVIMGAGDSKKRFAEASQLLSYGFNIYHSLVIAGKDEVIKEITIPNGKIEGANIVAPLVINVPIRKGSEDEINTKIEIREKLKAPLKKGEEVGKVKIYRGNLLLKEADLVIDRDVEKASIFQMIYRIIKHIFISLVNLFS